MKSTVIECPECAGHGGEGVYCEDCLSTGRITVYGPPAEVIDQLRAELAAAVGRAEAAEKDANELRVDNETSAHYAARALHAEAVLAAVPVEAIRRYFDHSDAFRDVQNGKYDIDQGRLDCQWIADWLDAQPGVKP